MKTLLLGFSLGAAIGVGAISPAVARDAAIILYDGANFTGNLRELSNQVYDLNTQRFDDTARSLVVVSGEWEICSDIAFQGCRRVSVGGYSDLSGLGLTGMISSLRPLSPAPNLIAFTEAAFGGENRQFSRSVPSLGEVGFNDRIASIQVNGGSWEICSDINYQGRCQRVLNIAYDNIADLGFPSTLSSLRLIRPTDDGVTLYEADNLAGASVTLGSDVSNLSSVNFSDRAASAIVSEGTWEVCIDVRYGGYCQLLREGAYPDLTSIGFPRNISSLRRVN